LKTKTGRVGSEKELRWLGSRGRSVGGAILGEGTVKGVLAVAKKIEKEVLAAEGEEARVLKGKDGREPD